MPVLLNAGSYVIAMYFEDHEPPHVHVVAPDFEALVRIRDAVVFRGSIPPKFAKEALKWIAEKPRDSADEMAEVALSGDAPGDALPRVEAVIPGKKNWVLNVVWSDRQRSSVDLTGLIHRSRHFRRFVEDPPSFRRVAPINFGSGIGWENGLDYSADALRTVSEEQRPMKGENLVAFQQRHQLSTAEMASLLGISERTVRAYRSAKALPATVAMSLRSLDSDPARFAAHFRPSQRRHRGRPRKPPVSGS